MILSFAQVSSNFYSTYFIALCTLFVPKMVHAQNVDSLKENSKLPKYYQIETLLPNTNDKKYGFSQKKPIKIGRSEYGGGSGNEKAYFELLLDAQGNSIEYKKIGSCCSYKSDNGFLGNALLNQYEISFHANDGKFQKAIVFISHFDFENPKVLFGFSSKK